MLIESPRHTPQDLDAWKTLVKYDRVFSQGKRLEKLTAEAIRAVQDFADAGPCYGSTSWGKDSTVLADIMARADRKIPLIWVRVKHWENPDCELVRDAFFAKHPHMADRYEEIEVEATAARWWEDPDGERPSSQRTSRGGFQIAERKHGDRHISGVRAEESRVRGIAMRRWGVNGPRASRPIGWWTAVDVFAHLEREGLPVHPAYAMSHGGRLDRRWLRVSSLGGIRGADKGRAEWESYYYPDVLAKAVKN